MRWFLLLFGGVCFAMQLELEENAKYLGDVASPPPEHNRLDMPTDGGDYEKDNSELEVKSKVESMEQELQSAHHQVEQRELELKHLKEENALLRNQQHSIERISSDLTQTKKAVLRLQLGKLEHEQDFLSSFVKVLSRTNKPLPPRDSDAVTEAKKEIASPTEHTPKAEQHIAPLVPHAPATGSLIESAQYQHVPVGAHPPAPAPANELPPVANQTLPRRNGPPMPAPVANMSPPPPPSSPYPSTLIQHPQTSNPYPAAKITPPQKTEGLFGVKAPYPHIIVPPGRPAPQTVQEVQQLQQQAEHHQEIQQQIQQLALMQKQLRVFKPKNHQEVLELVQQRERLGHLQQRLQKQLPNPSSSLVLQTASVLQPAHPQYQPPPQSQQLPVPVMGQFEGRLPMVAMQQRPAVAVAQQPQGLQQQMRQPPAAIQQPPGVSMVQQPQQGGSQLMQQQAWGDSPQRQMAQIAPENRDLMPIPDMLKKAKQGAKTNTNEKKQHQPAHHEQQRHYPDPVKGSALAKALKNSGGEWA